MSCDCNLVSLAQICQPACHSVPKGSIHEDCALPHSNMHRLGTFSFLDSHLPSLQRCDRSVLYQLYWTAIPRAQTCSDSIQSSSLFHTHLPAQPAKVPSGIIHQEIGNLYSPNSCFNTKSVYFSITSTQKMSHLSSFTLNQVIFLCPHSIRLYFKSNKKIQVPVSLCYSCVDCLTTSVRTSKFLSHRLSPFLSRKLWSNLSADCM